MEVHHSPPPLHSPGDVTTRPRGILKNPSFSGPSGRQGSPEKYELPQSLAPTPLDAKEAKDLTLQNTIQNAGHRRSSSAARRASASRRHSSAVVGNNDDSEKMRLKWDEANLFLAEQQSGGRMKITEPKTPFQHGNAMEDVEDEEDIAVDPRFVDVDEVDMAKRKGLKNKKARESDIPGLELGEPEDDLASRETGAESDRIVHPGSEYLSREGSKEKHVSVSGGSGEKFDEAIGAGDPQEEEKHRQFEQQRKRHYEMKDIRGLLGHPEDMDMEDDDDNDAGNKTGSSIPNGVR